MRVGVIDYGVGNLGSVLRALEVLRATPILISRAVDLKTADCFILPGVGNFTDCAQLLSAGGWTEPLADEVLGNNKPLLGVCVGMQLLADSSTEGAQDEHVGTKGLGFVPGQVKHLRTLGCKLRIPHVGWNGAVRMQLDDQLFNQIPDETDFYFVHSYAFVPSDDNDLVATTNYGVNVAAAVRRGRVWGTQFHPEKSSRAGLQLLNNFILSVVEC